MAGGNFNMEDPGKQEQVRRGHHRYEPTAGKHGTYVPTQYKHQEYPKMLGKWPKPELKNFLVVNGVAIPQDHALQQWQTAIAEWDRAMSSSVVNSRQEEQLWLKEN